MYHFIAVYRPHDRAWHAEIWSVTGVFQTVTESGTKLQVEEMARRWIAAREAVSCVGCAE